MAFIKAFRRLKLVISRTGSDTSFTFSARTYSVDCGPLPENALHCYLSDRWSKKMFDKTKSDRAKYFTIITPLRLAAYCSQR